MRNTVQSPVMRALARLLGCLWALSCWMPPVAALQTQPTPRMPTLDLSFFPSGHLFDMPIADPYALRTEVMYKFIDHDEIRPDETGHAIRFDPSIATRFSFLRLSPQGRSDMGLELELGAMVNVYMDSMGFDTVGFDGVYYFALAGRHADWLSWRFMRHHICTHLGDELDDRGTGSPYADYDMGLSLNAGAFVRDDFVCSLAIDVGRLLITQGSVSLKLYGDASFFVYGHDAIIGFRNLIPADHAYGRFQYGAELLLGSKDTGALFAALHASHWELTGYAPNLGMRAGIVLPQGDRASRAMIAVHWYDGQSTVTNFVYKRERFVAFTVTFD